jgi:hypothetical protein
MIEFQPGSSNSILPRARILHKQREFSAVFGSHQAQSVRRQKTGCLFPRVRQGTATAPLKELNFIAQIRPMMADRIQGVGRQKPGQALL